MVRVAMGWSRVDGGVMVVWGWEFLLRDACCDWIVVKDGEETNASFAFLCVIGLVCLFVGSGGWEW